MQNYNSKLKSRLEDFYREITMVCKRCNRRPQDVTVLFATKYINPERFVSFIDICREINIVPIVIGENRVQEAEEKMEYLKRAVFSKGPAARHLIGTPGKQCVPIRHLARVTHSIPVDEIGSLKKYFSMFMIGNLQTNKINKAIGIFKEIHAIDSIRLAEDLNRRLEREDKTMPVFLEVNVSEEESKHGFRVEEMDDDIKAIKQLSYLAIKGLMTMAPYSDDPEKARPFFRKLRQLADKYGLQTSMGMSHDWKVAIEEGTDMIRIGGKIFKAY